MLNMKKVILMVTVASALTGCGRDNYDGKYTGYEQNVANSQTAGGFGGISGYGTDQRIELDLNHDNDIVSGTITYPDTGQTGQFSATSENSNKLDNVEIRIGFSYNQQMTGGAGMPYNPYSPMIGGMGMNCIGVFRGGLDAPGDGRRLTGSLTAVSTSGSLMGGSTCSAKNLTVNKQ